MAMAAPVVLQFLEGKRRGLEARAQRLAHLSPRQVGMRPQDMPYAPSPSHFVAANRRLGEIGQRCLAQVQRMNLAWPNSGPSQRLISMAMVEREVDRARRSFGMFFEIFSQRGSSFAEALAAHDVIAVDCYNAIRQQAPKLFAKPLLKPITYLEHGYSPATMRRGVQLARLLGDKNPFPVIRIPWDRDNPWQAVFLHEVAHNLQADLGLWHENRTSVAQRMMKEKQNPKVVATYSRWHKEIFADLAAILLGGPAAAVGMMTFLAHPAPRAMTFRAGGAHPTGYIRAFILAEMMERMGFTKEAADARKVWSSFYNPSNGHRIPKIILQSAATVIPLIVDEIAFQPRRALGQRALVNIISFTKADQQRILQGAMQLRAGRIPDNMPPRHITSAASLALGNGADPQYLSRLIIDHLSRIAAAQRARPLVQLAAVA
jgi:hypothetical protein